MLLWKILASSVCSLWTDLSLSGSRMRLSLMSRMTRRSQRSPSARTRVNQSCPGNVRVGEGAAYEREEHKET